MSKSLRYTMIAALFVLLVLIRVFESDLFYDPYLLFFKSDYLKIDHPNREVLKLLFFTTLRYVLNSVLSLGIIYLLFLDQSIVKFSLYIYSIAYVVLMLCFIYFVSWPRQEDTFVFFSFRRFLIQPVFLILLIPAFYYYTLKN